MSLYESMQIEAKPFTDFASINLYVFYKNAEAIVEVRSRSHSIRSNTTRQRFFQNAMPNAVMFSRPSLRRRSS